MVISRSVLRRLRNVSDKSCVENQNTYCVSKIVPFCEIMRKNIVEPGKSASDNMAYAHCVLDT